MVIEGAHLVIHSRRAAADRAFLRDVLGLRHVDAGDGWLIFALPAAEVGVHPGPRNGAHEVYLTCGDVERFVGRMERRGVRCSHVRETGWGRLVRIALPGGGRLGVYQPLHARPQARRARPAMRRS